MLKRQAPLLMSSISDRISVCQVDPSLTIVDAGGYSIDCHFRNPDILIVTFPSLAPVRAALAKDEPAWGKNFVAHRGYSAFHVKTNANCWYRRPELREAFGIMRGKGLFNGFKKIVTYGGSMGGYGALAYAGLCGATHCLALNPQTWLGPSVRTWENRFHVADEQSWVEGDLDVNEGIASVCNLVTACDPWEKRDAHHIEMISHPRHTKLHIPFVGHRTPKHLQDMKQLAWLFDIVVDDRLDLGEFYNRMRGRRMLQAWQNNISERINGSSWRQNVLSRHFSDQEGPIAPIG